MEADGRRHCGNITFEADINPEQVVICHCTNCQTLSASTFRTVVFVPERSFRLFSGELKTYLKTAENNNKRAQAFCPECGTHIYAAPAESEGPKTFDLRVGTLKQRTELTPKKQSYCRSALDWVLGLGAIEQVS